MTEEVETQKPFVIEGVQINPDELSDQGKYFITRLHEIRNEKQALLRGVQEKDILDRAFRNSLIQDYQKDQKIQEEEEEAEEETKEQIKEEENI